MKRVGAESISIPPVAPFCSKASPSVCGRLLLLLTALLKCQQASVLIDWSARDFQVARVLEEQIFRTIECIADTHSSSLSLKRNSAQRIG